MHRSFVIAAISAFLVFAACVGDDPGAGDNTSSSSGSSGASSGDGGNGTSSSSSGDGGGTSSSSGDASNNGGDADAAGPKCGYPGEDCCTTAPACRVGTQCTTTTNKCIANDIWVVGWRLSGLQKLGVSAHYDGVSWKEGPVFGSTKPDEAPNDVWGLAPGSYRAVNTNGDAIMLGAFVGTDTWDVCNGTNCPDPNTTNDLSSILGFANNDYWLAGLNVMYRCSSSACTLTTTGLPATFSTGRLGGTSSVDVWYPGVDKAFHYDGGTWGTMPNLEATAVWARAPNDVWVGNTKLQHYDGNAWSLPMNVGAAPTAGSIVSMSGSATDDVWAIGSNNSGVPFTAHWNGTVWSDVPISPQAESPQNVWAVSKTEAYLTGFNKGVYKWDGLTWTLMPGALQSNGMAVILAFTAVGGSARPRP